MKYGEKMYFTKFQKDLQNRWDMRMLRGPKTVPKKEHEKDQKRERHPVGLAAGAGSL